MSSTLKEKVTEVCIDKICTREDGSLFGFTKCGAFINASTFSALQFPSIGSYFPAVLISKTGHKGKRKEALPWFDISKNCPDWWQGDLVSIPDTSPGAEMPFDWRCATCDTVLIRAEEAWKIRGGALWTACIPDTMILATRQLYNKYKLLPDGKPVPVFETYCNKCERGLGLSYKQPYVAASGEVGDGKKFPCSKLALRLLYGEEQFPVVYPSAITLGEFEEGLAPISTGFETKRLVTSKTYSQAKELREKLPETSDKPSPTGSEDAEDSEDAVDMITSATKAVEL